MSAGRFDLIIEQGATFRQLFEWHDEHGNLIDVTGMTARMQIRRTYDADTAMVTLTDTDGITLGGIAGTVLVVITDEITQTLSPAVTAVYDIELGTPDGGVERFLEGGVRVTSQVTR